MNDRFEMLWTDYLEGELDGEEMTELASFLEDGECLAEAADRYQMHRLLGVMMAEDEGFTADTMAALPQAGARFTAAVMQKLPRRKRRWPIWLGAALLVLAGIIALRLFAPAPVTFANFAHARFFGQLSPAMGATVKFEQEYVLVDGLAELAFPSGASAIIEAPAVFRILSAEHLAMDLGICSIYAPDGAEGFEVTTPVTRVVDRGTAFTVRVAESAETDVQVIEGIADIYQGEERTVRLHENEGRRVMHEAQPLKVNAAMYRAGLPDRVLSYEASPGADGNAEQLTAVSLQRGGEARRYTASDLVRADLIHFRSTSGNAHLISAAGAANPTDALGDFALNTGVINPGGSAEPLQADPTSETPGMGIRFRRPVRNGPGPDIVLFEPQTIANPAEGDAFHISPMHFAPGRKSHSIRVYDLTLMSSEALKLTAFHLHRFERPVTSAAELGTIPASHTLMRLEFQILATGIDLSDLGYAEGETVTELFIQDANDDGHHIDPVFIGGLP